MLHSSLFRLIKKSKWNTIIKRCKKKSSNEIQITNDAGWLPIHYACYKNAPLNVIQSLYEAYPNSINCKTNVGWLPINVACVGIASQDIIEYLQKVATTEIIDNTNASGTTASPPSSLSCRNKISISFYSDDHTIIPYLTTRKIKNKQVNPSA